MTDERKPRRIIIEPELVEEDETLPAIPKPKTPEFTPPKDVEGQQRDLLGAALRSLKSPATRKAYKGHWKRFAAYHGHKPGPFVFHFLSQPKAVAMDMVNDFADHLEEEEKAASTIAVHLRAIISMTHRWHLAEVSPWTLHGLIQLPETSPYSDVRGVSPEGVEAMIKVTKFRGTAESKRDLAILCLLHDSALRRREVASLDVLHWRLDSRTMMVWGKGNARGVRVPQPVSKRGTRAVEEWLDVRGRGPGALFPRLPIDEDHPEAISVDMVRNIVDRAARSAGVTETVSPHRLRHAGITAFARRTKDPDAVRRFARHTSFDTTTIYMQAIDDVVINHMDDDERFD